MQSQTIAAINAILFFFFWLFVLLAGADFPQPVGFLWLVIVVAACAYVVYWRVPTYIDWNRSKRPRRHLRVIFEGFAAGIVVAAPFLDLIEQMVTVAPKGTALELSDLISAMFIGCFIESGSAVTPAVEAFLRREIKDEKERGARTRRAAIDVQSNSA
ncbi:MAG: hypothetical protein JSV68_01975 [Anaerolineaceae bacterium]|nr:MAG: hypothetical protein JSV68_01975 [Anaerolineaceae bacterium]